MRSIRALGSLFIGVLLCSSVNAYANQSFIKKRVLADLESIRNIFEVKYAPKMWKHEYAQWDLTQAIEDAKNKIASHPAPTLKECQMILKDFFNSTKDYHVNVRFFSTECATLPFIVKGAENRFFICYVDRDNLSKREFPFDEGDEIIAFGGRPVGEVIEEIRLREYGANTLETDQALAEKALTQRRGDLGHAIPSGSVEIVGYKKGDPKKTTITMKWSYIPEKIKDFSQLNPKSDLSFSIVSDMEQDMNGLLKESQFFEKFMVSAQWYQSFMDNTLEVNKHSMGSRCSFIPTLGDKIWKSASDSIFDAYTFETQSGKKIGYIRLPHYMGDAKEVTEFGTVMNHLQRTTDALIIDQINNPGGSVFYLYGLAATLADKPFYAPKHRIALTQDEVFLAHLLLPLLEKVSNDDMARIVLGQTIGGYPVDYKFVRLMKQFCQFVISQWESGKLFSDPTFLFGVDTINPHPKYRYSKPVLLLINSLDFSGGDFFPAILQDNKRATILGSRTAGAGGYVLTTVFPNHSGMKQFVMTGSLAERIDKRPIENLGVTPDIQYDLTVTDLQEDYKEYVSKILETVESLAKKN